MPEEHIIEGHALGGEGLPEKTRVLDFLRSVAGVPVSTMTIAEALYEDADRSRIDGIGSTLRKLRSAGTVENHGETEKGGRGNTAMWVLASAQPTLATGQVDASDRCSQCDSLQIVAYDESNRPRCEAHKPEGAWL